jgi:hypothetical protein
MGLFAAGIAWDVRKCGPNVRTLVRRPAAAAAALRPAWRLSNRSWITLGGLRVVWSWLIKRVLLTRDAQAGEWPTSLSPLAGEDIERLIEKKKDQNTR